MKIQSPKLTAENVREWLQFIVIVVAGLWGAYTFIYKEIIIPAARPASLEVSGEMENIGQKDGNILVRVRIYVSNIREIKVYAPAIWFTVRGLDLEAVKPANESYGIMQIDAYSIQRARYGKQEEIVLAAWRFQDDGNWYQPGDETSNDYLFYVPEGQFEALQLKLEFMVTKNIDLLANVRWQDTDGVFSPTLMIKDENGTDAPFNYENARHLAWSEKVGLSYNWFLTTLSLLNNETQALPVQSQP